MSENLNEKTSTEDEGDKDRETKISKERKNSKEIMLLQDNSENNEKESDLEQSSNSNDEQESSEKNNEMKRRLRKNPKKTILPYSKEDLDKFEKKKKVNQSDLKEEDFKLFKNIVDKLRSNPKAISFRLPAIRQFETKRDKDIYKSVISHPMDLSYMSKKIGALKYNTYQEFYDDFHLIWDNAQLFNISESNIYKDAEYMRNYTEKIFKEKKIDDKVIHKEREIKDEDLDAKFTENFIENINKIESKNYETRDLGLSNNEKNGKNYVGKKRKNNANDNNNNEDNSDDEIQIAPIIDIKNSDDEKLDNNKNMEHKNKKNFKTKYITSFSQFRRSSSSRNSTNEEKKLENILEKMKEENNKHIQKINQDENKSHNLPENNKNNQNSTNSGSNQKNNNFYNYNINSLTTLNQFFLEEIPRGEENVKWNEETIKSYSYKIAKKLDKLTDDDMFDLIEFIETIKPEAIDDTGNLLKIDMTKFEGDTYINVLNFVENAIFNNSL